MNKDARDQVNVDQGVDDCGSTFLRSALDPIWNFVSMSDGGALYVD
jgi:hypothetical protein